MVGHDGVDPAGLGVVGFLALALDERFALHERVRDGILAPRDVRLPAPVVEDAFIAVNPAMGRDGITVTCDGGRVGEVRICLTRDLQPRACAPDSRRDCRAPMLMEAPG